MAMAMAMVMVMVMAMVMVRSPLEISLFYATVVLLYACESLLATDQ